MPINKPAAISAALLLAISSIAQAETDFDFNRIPAAERQRFFQETANEINKELPYTRQDGSITLYKVSCRNNQFIYDIKIDLDKMDILPEIRSPEAIHSILQPAAAELICKTSEMVEMNKQVGLTARYHIQGWRQPVIVTMPKGHCAAYRNKTRDELAADSVTAMASTIIPQINRKLPIQYDNATLERVTFDADARVMHQYFTQNDPELAALSPSAIRQRLQQQTAANLCRDPSAMRMNHYYSTTIHITLPGHATPFEITIPKGHCDRQH